MTVQAILLLTSALFCMGIYGLVTRRNAIALLLSAELMINAVTINSAYAMGLSESHGSITKGKKASVIVTKEISSYGYLPYAFGSNLIDMVIIDGNIIS